MCYLLATLSYVEVLVMATRLGQLIAFTGRRYKNSMLLLYSLFCFSLHKKTATSHWASSLNFHGCLKQDLPGGIHDSGFASIRRAFFLPSVRVTVNEHMIRNLSLALEELANSTAKAAVVQQPSFDSLANIVLDNHIHLDYLLSEQGGICAIVNTTFADGETPLGK